MERNKAQRRLLICAAFFSFGALNGAMTFSRLSAAAAECFGGSVSGFLLPNLMLTVPLSALIAPLLLILCGASPFGAVFISCLLLLFGFASGAAECALIRLNCLPWIMGAFLLLYGLCLLQIGGVMVRRASLVRSRLSSDVLIKPDYGYDRARVIASIFVLILAALAFAYFVLNI